ncbi:MAG: GNAT family N-acetyltransferase [Bacteroidia bacterium]|nr:GNAT family N-acetyltransferase [Bacteroidia bacterium]
MAKASLHILSGKDILEEDWDNFVKQSPHGGFYAQHAYLSILREDWKAYVVIEAEKWKAVMPFVLNKRGRYLSIPQLPFTQFLGVMFAPLNGLPLSKRYSSYLRYLGLLINDWERVHLIVQNFSPSFEYGIPFHSAGFDLRKRYTFILDLEKEVEDLHSDLSKNIQRNIKKAISRELIFHPIGEAKEVLEILAKNKNQGKDLMGGHSASWDLIGEVANFFEKSESGKLVHVVNGNGEIQATNMLGFWGDTAYSLLGIVSPEARKDGGMAFLMWNCILYAKEQGYKYFDFEGSMIPGVARYFQEFGPRAVSYLQISRNRLPKLLRWIQELRT